MSISKFDSLLDTIHAYLSQFREQFDLVSRRLKNAPEGSLKIVRKGRRAELYHRAGKSDRQGTYLNKSKLTLAKKLAQKDYDTRAAKILDRKINLLAVLEKFYPKKDLEGLYDIYPQKVKQLIKPLVLSQEEYCTQWENVSYKGRSFDDITTVDNEDYRNKAISKLAKYSEAGFVPGRNFIYTMETTKTPLNSWFVKHIIQENFA